MTKQCKDCHKTCAGKRSKDPCKSCVHNNKQEQYTTCLDCGIACHYTPRPQKQPKGKACPLCGKASYLQEHHLIAGSNRQMSDRYGLTINICPECHSKIHQDAHTMALFMGIGQLIFEQRYPQSDFAALFGKNFICDSADNQAAREILNKIKRREPIF